MRVLMLAQFYPPTQGGEEQHVRTLSHALVRAGHEVAVATLWHAPLPELELDRGVRIYRMRTTTQRAAFLFSESARRHAPPFPDPGAVLALSHIVAREQPDIVHAHNWLLHSFLPIKQRSNARFVVTLHDYSLVCAKKRLVYRGSACSGPETFKCLGCAAEHYGIAKGIVTTSANWAMGFVERRLVDFFIAVSEATARDNGLANSGRPYQVIPNMMPDEADTETGEVAPYLEQLPDGEFLLFVGDVVADKGILTLLKAYSQIAVAPPLVLIGRTFPSFPLELPPNVRMLGSWPHEAVIEAYRRSMISLLPSEVPETFGISILEAMSMGRPVIASRIGGLPDVVVDGETGILTPPGDAASLQKAIERLLTDADLRRRMSRAALSQAEKFRASRIVPQIEQVYRTLVCQTRGETDSEMDHMANIGSVN